MSKIERPLSPHLQVYRPQLTSMLSILHRISGFGLAVGGLLMTWWLIAAAAGDGAFATFHVFAGSPIGQIMLFGWLFALIYHLLNGIRHLVWDAGKWLDLKSAYASGYAVTALAILLTALIWLRAGA